MRPSEVMGIVDGYTAFCFDEAVAYIITRMKEGEKPVMTVGSGNSSANYKKPSDLYSKYHN